MRGPGPSPRTESHALLRTSAGVVAALWISRFDAGPGLRAWFERKLRAVPGKPIVITFDDAYLDFYDNAWPLLQHYGFPATVFVPTGHVGGDAAWDSTHGQPAPIMGWDQIVRLGAAGVQIGSRSCCHRPMTELAVGSAGGCHRGRNRNSPKIWADRSRRTAIRSVRPTPV